VNSVPIRYGLEELGTRESIDESFFLGSGIGGHGKPRIGLGGSEGLTDLGVGWLKGLCRKEQG